MKTVWLTYAWTDNEEHDVEFIAHELEDAGLEVMLDRWDIEVGARLWEQIGEAISSPDKTDGWLIYATQNSFSSEACKEEYYMALDRALHTRGGEFPIIALFPSSVDREVIPPGIKMRRYVRLMDNDWKTQVLSALEVGTLRDDSQHLQPYQIRYHENRDDPRGTVIELRPRAGSWSRFIVGIPAEEKDEVKMSLRYGPKGKTPFGSVLHMVLEAESSDGHYWCISAADEATPTFSYYVKCGKLPTRILFGVEGGQPLYILDLKQSFVYTG